MSIGPDQSPPPRPKPPHGSPCNQCGYCCRQSMCLLGMSLFEDVGGACPALETRPDGSTACGVMLHPAKYDPARALDVPVADLLGAAGVLIGVGVGCDSLGVGEREDLGAAERWAEEWAAQGARVLAAVVVWGV